MNRYPNAVSISAKTREGIEKLHEAVSEALSRSFLDLDVETSVANGRLLAYLAAHGEVLSKDYLEDRVVVHVRLPARHVGPVYGQGTTVRHHHGAILVAPGEEEELPVVMEDVA